MSVVMRRSRSTPEQLQALGKFLSRVFIEMRRIPSYGASVEQCAKLADAMHNLPMYMLTDEVEWDWILGDLRSYDEKYPEESQFSESFEEIIEMA